MPKFIIRVVTLSLMCSFVTGILPSAAYEPPVVSSNGPLSIFSQKAVEAPLTHFANGDIKRHELERETTQRPHGLRPAGLLALATLMVAAIMPRLAQGETIHEHRPSAHILLPLDAGAPLEMIVPGLTQKWPAVAAHRKSFEHTLRLRGLKYSLLVQAAYERSAEADRTALDYYFGLDPEQATKWVESRKKADLALAAADDAKQQLDLAITTGLLGPAAPTGSIPVDPLPSVTGPDGERLSDPTLERDETLLQAHGLLRGADALVMVAKQELKTLGREIPSATAPPVSAPSADHTTVIGRMKAVFGMTAHLRRNTREIEMIWRAVDRLTGASYYYPRLRPWTRVRLAQRGRTPLDQLRDAARGLRQLREILRFISTRPRLTLESLQRDFLIYQRAVRDEERASLRVQIARTRLEESTAAVEAGIPDSPAWRQYEDSRLRMEEILTDLVKERDHNSGFEEVIRTIHLELAEPDSTGLETRTPAEENLSQRLAAFQAAESNVLVNRNRFEGGLTEAQRLLWQTYEDARRSVHRLSRIREKADNFRRSLDLPTLPLLLQPELYRRRPSVQLPKPVPTDKRLAGSS